MNAKIDNFSEMEKVLRVKNDTNDGMLALFGRFGIGYLPCHLSMKKRIGIDAVTLIFSLCLFGMNSLDIFSTCRNRFHGLLDYGKQCRKHKCHYIALRKCLGVQPVRIFLIKYRRNRNRKILLSSDTDITFIKAFELHQIRRNIKVLNKENKGCLNHGRHQGKNRNGQIADCILYFITYTVLAPEKRLSEYGTTGDFLRTERGLLPALTLCRRILSCIEQLLIALSKLFDMEQEQLRYGLLNGERKACQFTAIINVRRKDNPENMGFAV